MQKIHVAVVVIRYEGKILLLKRASSKKHFPSKWENIGGKIDEKEMPESAAVRETFEETGMKGRIIRKGSEFEVENLGAIFHVHPFLFEPQNNEVKLSEEHTEYTWINLEDYKKYDCVDEIEKDYVNLGMIQNSATL